MKVPAATIALCGFVIAAAAVTFVGCSEATAGLEDVSEVVGVYDLKTVAGEPPLGTTGFAFGEIDGVPVQIFTTEVLGAILTLELDRSFSDGRSLRTEVFTLDGELLFDETVATPGPVGTWSYSRPSITLRYAIGIVDTGTVESGLLTIIRDGSAWVYERR
jgi:hypothetical protein